MAGGQYLFTFLPPGEYIVWVDASNFLPGGALYGLANSPGETDPDNDINDDDNGVMLGAPFGGVASKALTLTAGGEPINDGDNSEYTNLTIDFGFTPGVAIGNRVWCDTDSNGRLNGSETGPAGVTVQLYGLGGDGTAYTADDPLVAQQTTGSGGYYTFLSVAQGSYYVAVVKASVPAQCGLMSSPGGGDNPDADDEDAQGGDDGVPGTFGSPIEGLVVSGTLEATVGGQTLTSDLGIRSAMSTPAPT